MTPRKGKPAQGEKGQKAAQEAERKLARGKGKGTYEYPGQAARRGQRENT